MALFFLLLCACEAPMRDPAGALEKQGVKYWTERLVNKNFEYTYKEELEKGLPPFSEYEKRLKSITRIPTSLVKFHNLRIEGNIGFVNYYATCRLKGIAQKIDNVPLSDRWVIKGNRWKHDYQAELK